MTERQQKLLNFIIEEYIKTAQPVGSKTLADASDFDLSSATIRNEMAELENSGYIYQPHTSAGRIPTEMGYRFYVDNFTKVDDLGGRQKNLMSKLIKEISKPEPESIKMLAKGLAEIANQAIVVGFSPNNVYYTGLSNLFNQPEFAQHELVFRISQIIDHLDQVMFEIFNSVNDDVKILIGKNNPFGSDCSTVLTKYQFKNQPGLLGILGPMRMNYQQNINLVNFSQQFINKL